MAIENYETRSTENAVDSLNKFLRGEISAVETYQQALPKIDDQALRAQLQDMLRSHENRAARLRNQISQLGGQPSEGSGVWGGFAKLIEGGAKVFGVKAALAALEEGEDHGLRLYRDEIDNLDPSVRTFVLGDLLPEQERTHNAMSSLKHSVH